ncbi:MAG: DUF2318 domain-containing protein [Treponema sp.]|jgi:hypothetical protein|nr:DUF2318 domain-containing protein [Treponema sp.]
MVRKYYLFGAVVLAGLILFGVNCYAQNNNNQRTKVIYPGEFLEIHISEIIKDISFYPITVNRINMEIIMVRGSDNTLRITYNACKNCYRSGKGFFIHEDDELVCQKCKMRFHIDIIGLSTEDCQPISITDENLIFTDNSIRISYENLSGNTRWFQHLNRR